MPLPPVGSLVQNPGQALCPDPPQVRELLSWLWAPLMGVWRKEPWFLLSIGHVEPSKSQVGGAFCSAAGMFALWSFRREEVHAETSSGKQGQFINGHVELLLAASILWFAAAFFWFLHLVTWSPFLWVRSPSTLLFCLEFYYLLPDLRQRVLIKSTQALPPPTLIFRSSSPSHFLFLCNNPPSSPGLRAAPSLGRTHNITKAVWQHVSKHFSGVLEVETFRKQGCPSTSCCRKYERSLWIWMPN